MAKDIANYPAWAVQGGTLASGLGATWLKGVLVGIDSSGNAALGDFRSASRVIALGAALQDARMLDPKGNVLDTITQGSWTAVGKINGLTVTAGKPYYLTSGGGISATKVATVSGDIDQVVGIAVSSTELQLQIGSPIVKE